MCDSSRCDMGVSIFRPAYAGLGKRFWELFLDSQRTGGVKTIKNFFVTLINILVNIIVSQVLIARGMAN